jgi:transposase
LALERQSAPRLEERALSDPCPTPPHFGPVGALASERQKPRVEGLLRKARQRRALLLSGPVKRLLVMPQNFLRCDRDQALLMPPSLREWIGDDHLAWLVLDVVGEIDLGEFYGAYRADGHGRAAHDPAMMVALLLYSYALGQRSSRAIERRCHEDVPTRAICSNQAPDHPTIARFRARHQEALAATFTQVLALCAKAGLVSVGVVAVDGTAMAANASREATRSYGDIREEVNRMLGEAAQVDAAEDAEHGTSRGDELPAELADHRSRLARLRRCRQELDAEQAQVQAAYDDNLAWRARWEAEHGRTSLLH